jgi:hypothetical protein
VGNGGGDLGARGFDEDNHSGYGRNQGAQEQGFHDLNEMDFR